MCGYCIESHLLNILESEWGANRPIQEETLNGCLIEPYAQESNFLMHAMLFARPLEMEKEVLYILHCRALEEIILRPASANQNGLLQAVLVKHYHSYLNVMRPKPYYEDIEINVPDPTWVQIYEPDFIFDRNKRQNFLKNRNLVEQSISLLENYYNWWLVGKGQQKNNLQERMEKTGVLDPIEDIAEKEWDLFYLIFPAVYFALVYLKSNNYKADILEKIALTEPHGVPHFQGFDLWLQRKAFQFTFEDKGIPFLIKNLSPKIRPLLVYYTFLKEDDARKDKEIIIEKFKSVLAEENQRTEFSDDITFYLEKIAAWTSNKKYH